MTSSFKVVSTEIIPPTAKDLVSRFTLDSATEFLFDSDVKSLSAGLPYPPNTVQAAHFNNDSHPANKFARSFAQAQMKASERTVFGALWPLFEIFGDNTAKHMKVIGKFIDPILSRALERKREHNTVATTSGMSEKVDTESFLEHMIGFTDGERNFWS